MQRRPQPRIGEALVIAVIMLRRHVDGGERAGAERLDLGRTNPWSALGRRPGRWSRPRWRRNSLTIGNSAAASPPAIGSSGCARATRLETTTTFTMTPPVSAVVDTAWGAVCSLRCAAAKTPVIQTGLVPADCGFPEPALAELFEASCGTAVGSRASGFRIGDGREQAHFGVPGIQPRVLHDDRHVGLEHRRIVGVARDRRRVVEIVEAQMQRAPRRDRDPIRADRLAIGEKDGDATCAPPYRRR